MGNSHDWDEIVSKLSQKYYCLSIDLPGHGQSTNLQKLDNIWDFDALSRRLSGLLTYQKIKITSLVGYSMGGRFALYFAINYPQFVSKLFLESASAGIESKDERETRFQSDRILAKKLQDLPFTDFLNEWYNLPLFSGTKKHSGFPLLLESRQKNDSQLLARAIESFSPGKQPYLMKKLSTLKMPVNLICGENDSKYLSLMTKFKQQNPQFSLEIFKECGHNVHFEKHVLFAEHLLQLLSL